LPIRIATTEGYCPAGVVVPPMIDDGPPPPESGDGDAAAGIVSKAKAPVATAHATAPRNHPRELDLRR
jgi:hypothetical protein